MFRARWRPLLLESVDAVPQRLPEVGRRDWSRFLALWNHFQDSLRGPARHRLKAIALRLRMDLAARTLLQHGSKRDQLMAALTLGHLGDRESWSALERLMRDSNPLLCVAAARALLLIDPTRAAELVVAAAVPRPDWPLSRLLPILEEAGTSAVTHPLAAAFNNTPPSLQPRLVAMLDAGDPEFVSLVLRRLLERSDEPEVLIACLKSAHAPRDRTIILRYMRHPAWQIRAQAARIFPSAAIRGDEAALLHLLADPAWWVRHRAAQALQGLPFLTPDALQLARERLTDPFARDMLDQILAEGTRA